MGSLSRHSRMTITLGLIAPGLFAAAAEAATEVVTGVINCRTEAPRKATMDATNGILERGLACLSVPAGGDCTEQIRRDLDDRGCTFRRDKADEILYFVCSGPRQDMIEVIDLVCRRLNGF